MGKISTDKEMAKTIKNLKSHIKNEAATFKKLIVKQEFQINEL